MFCSIHSVKRYTSITLSVSVGQAANT
uniref:Uncharacterized protein n=1 Tax=Anguilla anguilla TaxID=7936 RepID=A0A0E9QVW2_ANGAN